MLYKGQGPNINNLSLKLISQIAQQASNIIIPFDKNQKCQQLVFFGLSVLWQILNFTQINWEFDKKINSKFKLKVKFIFLVWILHYQIQKMLKWRFFVLSKWW